MSVTIDGSDVELDVQAAIGTIAECLEQGEIEGSFDNYRYCAANGREVLLGHQPYPAVKPGEVIEVRKIGSTEVSTVNSVFVSKGSHHRNVSTWEELRGYSRDDWVIGTDSHPGVKFWFVSSGRNSRREATRIFVV